jgi:hypothetical protein
MRVAISALRRLSKLRTRRPLKEGLTTKEILVSFVFFVPAASAAFVVRGLRD